jgi:hypothetical protein
MPSRLEILLEAERRGKMTPEMAGILSEARKRGLAPPPLEPAQSGGFFDAGKKAARAAEFGSRGFMDSAMETVGAIPELVASGLRYTGLPAPEPGYYADTLKKGYRKLGQALSAPISNAVDFGPNVPVNDVEKGAYGAGRGVADVASFMVPGAALARTARAGTTANAVGKAMMASPVLQSVAGSVGGATTEVTGEPLLGMAASMATPLAVAGLPRVITPIGRNLSSEEARLAALFEKEGGKLTAGQATGSKPLRAIESSFTQLPLTSRAQHEIYGAQREAFNRMVLGKAGIGAKEATPEVMESAFNRIGSVFDDIARRTTVVVDRKLSNDIDLVVQNYGRRLPRDVSRVFDSYVDDINVAINASRSPGALRVTIDGETYKNIASDIRRAARSSRSNPSLQGALFQLGKALDGAMGRSVPKALKGEWNQARRDYRNLLMIDDSMAMAPAADMVAGNIPFGALKNAVRQSDPRGFSRGRGGMNDMARIGTFLGSTKLPDSGTPIRTNAIKWLQGGPLAAGGTGGYALGGSPEMVLAGAGTAAATSLGLPKLVQMGMNSDLGQAYLRNNLLPPNIHLNRLPGLLRNIAAANQMGQIKRDNPPLTD